MSITKTKYIICYHGALKCFYFTIASAKCNETRFYAASADPPLQCCDQQQTRSSQDALRPHLTTKALNRLARRWVSDCEFLHCAFSVFLFQEFASEQSNASPWLQLSDNFAIHCINYERQSLGLTHFITTYHEYKIVPIRLMLHRG